MLTRSLPRLLVLLSSVLEISAANACGYLVEGRYQYERNLNVLTTGPISCSSSSVSNRFLGELGSAFQTGTGGPTYANAGSGLGLNTVASTGIGSNHAAAQGGPGLVSSAISLWTDVMSLTGPVSPNLVTISFFGHLDGHLTRWDGLNTEPSARVNYLLQIGTTSFRARADPFTIVTGTWSGDPPYEPLTGGDRGPFVPGADDSNDLHFRIDLDVMFLDSTPLRFGVISHLMADAAFPGNIADFGNTASLDWIEMPSGYSISAHGVTLTQDAQGRYLYAAAVPETQSAAMLLVGLLALGLLRYGRKYDRNPGRLQH